MQDWLRNCHDLSVLSLKTATQQHAEDSDTCITCEQQPWSSFFSTGAENVKSVKQIGVVFALLTALCGCATGVPRGYVNAEAWGANYTEDYIHQFTIETADGQETPLEGVQVKPFSKGGTGGVECCSPIPGVGQMIRVVWRVGGYNEPPDLWNTYSKTAMVTGTISKGKDTQSALIVRFFPGHEIEVEFVPMDGNAGANSRDDQLFYGRRVMRRLGE